MSDEWREVQSLDELKELVEKYRGDTRYKWEEFKFKKSGADDKKSIDPMNHCEFLIIYKGNHVETFSLDRMSVDTIRSKLNKIREADPSSMNEWLDR